MPQISYLDKAKKENIIKLVYYGTSAGAGIPEIFCSCRICEQVRFERGKNIRTRSQAVLDGVLSIDYPVDVFMHRLHGGLLYPQDTPRQSGGIRRNGDRNIINKGRDTVHMNNESGCSIKYMSLMGQPPFYIIEELGEPIFFYIFPVYILR